MCLTRLSTETPEPTGFGWKVFKPGPTQNTFAGSIRDGEYTVGQWNVAVNCLRRCEPEGYETRAADLNEYVVGFHIFVNRSDADQYREAESLSGEVTRRVEYRRARLKGEGRGWSMAKGPQIVADEMRILEEASHA